MLRRKNEAGIGHGKFWKRLSILDKALGKPSQRRRPLGKGRKELRKKFKQISVG